MPISTGTIKFIRSLRTKKGRQNYHKFTAEGARIVEELLLQERFRVEHVYGLENWVARQRIPVSIPVTTVSPNELSRISQLSTPNQVLAVVNVAESVEAAAPLSPWCLFLDGVQSPANLGALLRIADWFGCATVVGGPGTADLYNAKSIQASMGSFLRLDYRTGELADLTARHPAHTVFGADLAGERIDRVTAPERGILVVGAEGPGVSSLARTQVQRWVTIPRAPGRTTESLNVAVATGIIVQALTKQGTG